MAGYPLKRRDENGIWQKEERFRIQTGLQGNYIPAHGSTNSEGMVINGVEINEGLEGFPGISEVALTWKYPDINRHGTDRAMNMERPTNLTRPAAENVSKNTRIGRH